MNVRPSELRQGQAATPSDIISAGDTSKHPLTSVDSSSLPISTVSRRPLALLWLLFGAGIVGGIAEWIVWNRPPWEGFGAAATIAGLIQIVARVKGIPAWPWQHRW